MVIVAGDSDYIPLAQRCKRLGRYVVGVGVAGSSSRSLAAACDEFLVYDALPGVPVDPNRRNGPRAKDADADEPPPPDPQAAATDLLTRALRIGLEKDDADWLHNSAVKAQMKRMDPSFSEKSWDSSLSATFCGRALIWWSLTRVRRRGWCDYAASTYRQLPQTIRPLRHGDCFGRAPCWVADRIQIAAPEEEQRRWT